jgi:histidine ammonia-lyase
MGANAATKCLQVVINTEKVLSIELLNAAQALEFRRPLNSSSKIEKLVSEFRKTVPYMKNDEVLYELMHASQQFVKHHAF